MKKGELLGIKKGILQVAKKMKDSGKKVSEIAAATGLTEEEIRAL
jgi:predicted transposase YdaD